MTFRDWIKGMMRRGLAATLAAGLVVTCFPESAIINSETYGISDVYATSTDSTEDTSGLGVGWTPASDEDTDGFSSGTYDVEETTEAEDTTYKVVQNANTQSFKAFNNMENWMNRSYVEAPENTYSLTVATGATDGSKVLYFCINYKDKNGTARKQFLFPHVDAFTKSDDLLNYYYKGGGSSELNPDPAGGTYTYYYKSTYDYIQELKQKKLPASYKTSGNNYYIQVSSPYNAPTGETIYYEKSDGSFAVYRDSDVAENDDIYSTSYGRDVAAQLNYKVEQADRTALSAFSVQDYAFQTEAEISSIESIDVYIEVGSWTVQGMAVYKVDRYKGMEEYGLVSGQTFLDFEGRCIADIKKKDENAQLTLPLTSSGADSITRINQDTSKEIYVDDHSGASTTTTTTTGNDTNSYVRGFASTSAVRTVRMDFSDYYEGGLETFLNYEAKSMKEYDGIVEDIAMEIQYKDIHGWTRKVVLPVVISAYGEAMQSLGDEAILGFGQRGDTIAFQGLFPDFDTVVGKPVVYVGSWAREEIAKYGVKIDSTTSKMSSNLADTGSDNIRIAGISIYEGGCMPVLVDGTDSDGNTVRGATIQYLFENKYPKLYQTTDEVKGRQIKPDGSDSFKLSNYKSTAPLIGADKGTDKFLVTVQTSEKSKTDASSNLSLKLAYTTSNGQTAYTTNYKAKEASNDYMGIWPDVNGDNHLENSALVPEGSVSFLIEAKDFAEFVGAELTVTGDKSWIMKNIQISYVSTYDNRLAYLHDNESAGSNSHFWIERSAKTAEVFNLRGVDYSVKDSNGKDLTGADDDTEVGASGKVQKLDEEGNPMYDINGEPIYEDYGSSSTKKYSGDTIFQNNETYTLSFDSDNQLDVRTANYADVRYSMTFAQTQMDWGFFKVKKNYDIAVQVAPDNDYDDGNGNSGSKNHFYFQLIFKNGNSAYVLANQQLSADGFRSGREETFSISINQDYGELSAIRIIPEDTSSDSEPFDKLNIQKVTVSEQTSGGSYISYVIDQVGWIDIEYRDELESASSRGQKARTESELAKLYKISYRERNVKLLCEVTYEPWSGKLGQFIGSVKAVISYETASTGELKTKTIDCVKGMADYLNTTVNSVEAIYDQDGKAIVAPEGLGTISDPETMMRPNHTDRFVIPAISDLKSIKSITFTARNTAQNATEWNIGKVCISQIIKDGPLQLSDHDEYVRKMETKYLCMSDNKDTSINPLEINNIEEIPTFNMTYNEIYWSSEEWATPVTRVPDSTNDTVNIYVYPTQNRVNNNMPNMDVKLFYNLPFSQYESVAADGLKYITNGVGDKVYYVQGKNAANFLSSGKLKVHSYGDVTVNHAIVQHVKEGTVVGEYTYSYLDSTAKNYPTVEPRVNTSYIDSCREVLSLQFGPGTPTQELIAEDHDIAIGFTYTSTIDEGTTTYQSPYVYLTDVGINEISEGLFAEIPFDCSFVKEITGYSIAAYGNVTGNINNSCAQVYAKDGTTGDLTKRSYTSFKETYALSSRLEPHRPTSKSNFGEESVTPVSMTFTTTDISKGNDSTTHPSVKMLLKYKRCDGTKPVVAFQDITPYIQGTHDGFQATKTDNDGNEVPYGPQTVKFFLTDMSKDMSIINAVMTPYNSEVVVENDKAAINAESNEDEGTVQTILDEAGNGEDVDLNNSAAADLTQQILESRNATWTISKCELNIGFGDNKPTPRDNLDMKFSGYNTTETNTLRLVNITLLCDITKNTESKTTAVSGGTIQLSAKADDKLYGNVFVVDPAQDGFKVKAYKVIGNAAQEVPDQLSDITTEGFLFTVPKNETEANVVYRLEVYPTNGPDLVAKIEVTVEPTKEDESEENKEETDTGDPTKQKDDKPSEGTTEATTQATTESTTESTTEATSESTTEKPADTASPGDATSTD